MPDECELISVTCNQTESWALQNNNGHEEHPQSASWSGKTHNGATTKHIFRITQALHLFS